MSTPEHFMRRLDRLDGDPLTVAKFLEQHEDLRRLLLERVEIEDECTRIAVALADGGPWAVLAHDGALVTVLERGMSFSTRGTIVVGHAELLRALLDHDTSHVLAWVASQLAPHVAQIQRAHCDGEVAIAFVDLVQAAETSCRALGWGGGRVEVHPLNRTKAERIAAWWLKPRPGCDEQAVRHTATWLRGRRPGRVFVAIESACLCVNFTPPASFSLEPETIGAEGLMSEPTAASVAGRFVDRAKLGRQR